MPLKVPTSPGIFVHVTLSKRNIKPTFRFFPAIRHGHQTHQWDSSLMRSRLTDKQPSREMIMTSSKHHLPLALTHRDYLVLQTIAEYGALTAQQVSTLFFRPATAHGKVIPHSNCQYHLKRMRDLSYLQRVEQYQLLTE